MKVYTLEEAKEELIDNKELYEFKLWISIELEQLLMSDEKKNYDYRKEIRKLLNKIDETN